jgi:hypothetical protein
MTNLHDALILVYPMLLLTVFFLPSLVAISRATGVKRQRVPAHDEVGRLTLPGAQRGNSSRLHHSRNQPAS